MVKRMPQFEEGFKTRKGMISAEFQGTERVDSPKRRSRLLGMPGGFTRERLFPRRDDRAIDT